MTQNGYVYELPTVGRTIIGIDGGSEQKWPTPKASDPKVDVCDNGEYANRKTTFMSLPVAIKLWPTPTAHNAKETNAPSESERNTPTLAAQVGGQLNPTWVEWLMGFPIGFTASKDWVTPKSRSKPQSPGNCSEVSK
jgi:hypothetical protein